MAKYKIEWSIEASLDLNEIFDNMVMIIMIWDCRRDPEDKILDQRIKK